MLRHGRGAGRAQRERQLQRGFCDQHLRGRDLGGNANGLPGEPSVSGNSIIAGTTCGPWVVLARSTVNSNCLDYAWLHVFTVAGLAPEGLTRQGTNEPPTYITCPRATNAVDRWLRVMATSCPGVWEAASCTNLPPSRR